MNHRKNTGVAAVEFAIVLPLLLAILFGVVELSVALYDKAVITNASREAARAGIVLKDPKPTVADVKAVALNYCKDYLITFGATPAPSVTVSGAGGSFGTPLTVAVSYRYKGLVLSSVMGLLGGTFPSALDISASVVMNNE